VVADVIVLMPGLCIAGIVDQAYPARTEIDGFPLLGNDHALPDLLKKGLSAIAIGVGQVTVSPVRARLYATCADLGFDFPVLRHPSAIVSASAQIASGTQLMAGTIVNPGTKVGQNVVVNTSSHIDHDCVIEDHVFIAPGVCISGNVTIRRGAFIGAGTTIIQNVTIGENALIGAGSTVLGDIPGGVVAVGTPCRPVGKVG
jgi:UDP-perosamine 4-acetyltransferase